MIEMITKLPLFPGDSEIDQLFRIFRVLGTPTEQRWPGVSQLPDFKPTFPRWQPQPLAKVLPALADDPLALDLLQKMLVYEPNKRISARDALKHEWFTELLNFQQPATANSTLPVNSQLQNSIEKANAALSTQQQAVHG